MSSNTFIINLMRFQDASQNLKHQLGNIHKIINNKLQTLDINNYDSPHKIDGSNVVHQFINTHRTTSSPSISLITPFFLVMELLIYPLFHPLPLYLLMLASSLLIQPHTQITTLTHSHSILKPLWYPPTTIPQIHF